jgi:Colicin V production protein
MSGADLFFLLLILTSLIFGARRGFYKEVVHAAALVAGICAATMWRKPVGHSLAEGSGLPMVLGEVVAAIILWVGVFFAVAVGGRLILKKIRGKGIDDNLDDGAEAFADRISGDTSKGPVTIFTDKLVGKGNNRRALFYWSDKILGTMLGGAKSVVTGYVLFGLVVFADRFGWENRLATSVEASFAARVYMSQLDPHLKLIPEYKIARDVTEIRAVAETIRTDPRKYGILVDHPELAEFKDDDRIMELAENEDVLEAWSDRDVSKLLLISEVQDLLADPEMRKKFSEIDWEQIRADVEAGQKPAPKPEPEQAPEPEEGPEEPGPSPPPAEPVSEPAPVEAPAAPADETPAEDPPARTGPGW